MSAELSAMGGRNAVRIRAWVVPKRGILAWTWTTTGHTGMEG